MRNLTMAEMLMAEAGRMGRVARMVETTPTATAQDDLMREYLILDLEAKAIAGKIVAAKPEYKPALIAKFQTINTRRVELMTTLKLTPRD